MARREDGECIPHRKDVGNDNIDHHDETTACCTLQGSASDEHLHVHSQGAYDGADQEDNDGYEEDRFAAPTDVCQSME